MTDTTSHEQTSANSGRATDGRFAKGNPWGPGNPFARKTAALRQALLDSVTEQDIKDIVCSLMLNAKAGNLASVKLHFQYVIGKPQPAVSPDTLDRDELELLQEANLTGTAFQDLTCKVPAPLAVELLRAVQPELTQHMVEAIIAIDHPPEDKPAEEPRRERNTEARRERRPIPNGENGGGSREPAPRDQEEAPSPIGEYGGDGGLLGRVLGLFSSPQVDPNG